MNAPRASTNERWNGLRAHILEFSKQAAEARRMPTYLALQHHSKETASSSLTMQLTMQLRIFSEQCNSLIDSETTQMFEEPRLPAWWRHLICGRCTCSCCWR